MIGEGPRSTNQAHHDHVARGVTVGFFTDVSLCIGCKACEVACKEWNDVPADGFIWAGESYDNTGMLGASTWRHVIFVERDGPVGAQVGPWTGDGHDGAISWTFTSDVCKHCGVAGCLEACPTGSIVRTEVGSVLVQDDVCNGCGYCVVACPFGVVDKRPAGLPGGGGAFKCTFCYDRQASGLVPACAKTCPTESIQFGPLDELHARAERRLRELRGRGYEDAHIYDPRTSVGGIHAFFLALDPPERLGLPPRPEAPTTYLGEAWLSAAFTAAATILFCALTFGLVR